jgi:hypothetical protein
LQYELEILDNLILDEINPDSSSFIVTNEKLEQWISISQSQKQLIQKRIICTTFSFNSDKKARIYIQNNQHRISALINTLSCYLLSPVADYDRIFLQTIEQVRGNLIYLLEFLSSQYRNYFDFNTEVTLAFKQQSLKMFQERVESIFNKDLGKYSTLTDIAIKPILEFLKDEITIPVSYQTINYYDVLLKEIEKVCFCPKPYTKCLKIELICINYNSFRFFAYLTDEIKKDLKSVNSHSCQVELLSKYLKRYNQIHEYPDLVLHPKQKSIKEQISVWIIEEIEHLERFHIHKHINEPQINKQDITNFKFQTDLSVAQLGYFIKVLMEIGIIKNPNQREVIRFCASQVKTKLTETISPESLRTRFYNIEESTREAVKEYVIKMLNYVNKKT